jgi:hypothetical protein
MTSVSDQAAADRHPAPGPHPATPGDRLLSAAEVAAILGGSYTARTVVRRWRKWELHGHRIGRRRTVSPALLEEPGMTGPPAWQRPAPRQAGWPRVGLALAQRSCVQADASAAAAMRATEDQPTGAAPVHDGPLRPTARRGRRSRGHQAADPP